VAGTREAPAVASRAESTPGAPFAKLTPGPGRSATEVAKHQRARIHHAVLEVVAERGYAGVTVREIASRGGISTRSFYQHYPTKEACFLGVHQSVVRRLLAGIEAAGTGTRDVAQRLRLVTAAIVDEWASDPRAARLMLIDAYSAGLPALKQARLAIRSIEARIGECLEYPPGDVSVTPLVAEAIVAGTFAAARASLLEGKGGLGDLGDPLASWVAAYHELPVGKVEEAKLALAGQVWTSNDAASSSEGEEKGGGGLDGDRALLLAATARLVASRESVDLEPEDIASTAGISQRDFKVEFSDPEACVAAAHEQYADRAVDRVVRVGERLAPICDARFALASFGAQVAADPTLAVLCFSDVATAGPQLVRSHDRFLARIASLVAGTTESAGSAAEASAGSLWGAIRQRVVMGRTAQAQELAPVFTSLALLPFQAASRVSTS
jgi:AcrR family transcriptional regulator